MLWEQHSTWTGMAITSIVLKLPNEEFVVARLLQNPVDFKKALSYFYDIAIALNFEKLLTEHLQLASEVIKATMDGDTYKAADLEKEWYGNADEISTLLGSINPYWSSEVWIKMFYEHLGIVKTQALDMINKNYKEAVDSQDLLEIGTLEMADIMYCGIIKQFPY